jgi:hypothetical protein
MFGLIRASIRGRSWSRSRSVSSDWSWCWSINWSWGWSRSRSRSGSRPVCWSRGRSIGCLDLSRVDSLTLILDISNITILVSSVGHNLGAGIREDDTVRSASFVSIPVLSMSKVV